MSLLKNHTTYPVEDYSYDLMLLHLAEPSQITDTMKVLGLPTQESRMGSTCYAPYPDELQRVELKLLLSDVCANAHPQKVTDVMLCAGHLQGGKDICVSDSGGSKHSGLYIKEDTESICF
uniref:Peptidase S1 domain-containing protein n=1 Tax=Rhinolophus ferrumequinum TaxID=59479 RepID=A0A671GAX0_RHIFE